MVLLLNIGHKLMILEFVAIGAYSSLFVDENKVKFLFVLMPFYSACMMIFGKKRLRTHRKEKMIVYFMG